MIDDEPAEAEVIPIAETPLAKKVRLLMSTPGAEAELMAELAAVEATMSPDEIAAIDARTAFMKRHGGNWTTDDLDEFCNGLDPNIADLLRRSLQLRTMAHLKVALLKGKEPPGPIDTLRRGVVPDMYRKIIEDEED